MSWDIALSETESGDYSACVVLLRRREVFYILEVLRGRFPLDTLKQKVMEVKRRHDSGTLSVLLGELQQLVSAHGYWVVDAMKSLAVVTVLGLCAFATGAVAQSWRPPLPNERCPSKWGAADERGSQAIT
jgi:hypothetical protein